MPHQYHANLSIPPPSAGHEAMRIWLGNWRAEGTLHRSNASTAPWISEEEFELLPGGYFVLHRWHEHGGPAPFAGVGVLSYDESSRTYAWRTFENHGFYRHYMVTRDGCTWTFQGETERATYEFSEDGRSQIIHWDVRRDAEEGWSTLCDRMATRTD